MSNAQNSAGTVPLIETERLVLRDHRLADFGAFAEIWADPAVVRHIGGEPQSEEEAWTRFLRNIGHWSLLGFGYWALEAKGSGRFVGVAGFVNFKRDTAPPLGEAPEIGWVLASEAHGRGYATEAVRAALAWGAQRFGPVRSVCLIDPENAASIRVAEKCGYAEFARTSYHGGPSVLFSRLLAAQPGL